MGNIQATAEITNPPVITQEEQNEINKNFKNDVIQHVIQWEKHYGLLDSFDVQKIYNEVSVLHRHRHRHHSNYKRMDDFVKLVSENLQRPHVIYAHYILFVVNPKQKTSFPELELTTERIHFSTQESKTAEQIHTDFADRKRQQLILSIQPAQKLKSEFFNRSSYYYSDTKDTVYEIESDPTPTLRSPLYEIEKKIRELNGLPAN